MKTLKPVAYISSLFLSALLFAQDISQMNAASMENMMQEMQKMQACMAKVDFSALASLQEKSFTVQQNIEKLCAQGKRDKAQSTAISFSKEVMSLPAIVQLKECSKNSAMGTMLNIDSNDFQKNHVCDGQQVDFGVPSNKRINW